jgi:hypothetical protein
MMTSDGDLRASKAFDNQIFLIDDIGKSNKRVDDAGGGWT